MRFLFLFSLLFFFTNIFADQLIIEPDQGVTPILSEINNAKSSINLVMYGLTDMQLIRALVAAKNHGVIVNVLLEPTPYQSQTENSYAETLLRLAHVNVQFANPAFQLTHQKTLMIDHQQSSIMNFNFTHSAFTKERNFAVVIANPQLTNIIEGVMTDDIQRKATHIQNPTLVFSPDNSRPALINFIRQAKKSIDIYAQDVTDYQTIGELAHAAQQGVIVHIVTNPPNKNNQNKFNFLEKKGVIIHASKNYYIHAKVIIIDHQSALLGSMNLTTPSIENNRELSLITQDPQLIDSLEKIFSKDFN